MKKIISFILALLILSAPLYAHADNIDITAHGAILTDAVSGEVVFEKNADERMYPASMTKMMVLLICMEKISTGEMGYHDKVTITKEATSLGGTQLFLEEGETRTIEELLYGIAVESANDAATAVGVHISGSVENFAALMNEKAANLGMDGTNFVNACGLHDEDHYTTCRDMAVLSRELLKYDDIFTYISTWTKDIYIGRNNDRLRSLANTNKLLSRYSHIDGIKTGYTSQSRHCMSVTGKIGDTRLIAVVMASENSEKRFDDAMTLLDYGFATYEGTYAVRIGKSYGNIDIINGESPSASLTAKEDFYTFGPKSDPSLSVKTLLSQEAVYAPVKAGDILGYAEVYDGEKLLGKVELTVKEDIPKCSLGEYLKRVKVVVF